MDIVARARGSMLGLMIGDALGAAVEGWPPGEIEKLLESCFNSQVMEDFIPAVPMGTFVPGPEPGTYREAKRIQDENFVPAGPPRNEAVASQCARLGMYTDDTNSCLAVAASLTEKAGVDAAAVGRRCAEFFRDNEAYRGCPPSAKQVQRSILEGVPVDETGLPPYFPYAGGSFANGGAMRISPVGIAYRNADRQQLRGAVEAACRATHRHPEGVDFAVVQAAAVQYALNSSLTDFDVEALLSDLASRCETSAMQTAIGSTATALKGMASGYTGNEDRNGNCFFQKRQKKVRSNEDYTIVTQIVEDKSRKRPGSGMGFQIASVHMAPCVLWCSCRYYQDPQLAVQTAINLGGDTDTTASMVGAIVGALHGDSSWCQEWAAKLENGAWGRDYALKLAEQLAALDLRSRKLEA